MKEGRFLYCSREACVSIIQIGKAPLSRISGEYAINEPGLNVGLHVNRRTTQ